MSKPNKFKITAFRAYENVDRCWEYLKGHHKVLQEHGLTHMLTFNEKWLFERNNIIVALCDMHNDQIYGGLRIQVRHQKDLPFEQTLKRLKLNLDDHIPRINDVELCGLWHSKNVSGLNLSLTMSQFAYSVAQAVINGRVFMFNAKYTFHIPQTMKFNVYDKIGINGNIEYPNEHFLACIWQNPRTDAALSQLQALDYATMVPQTSEYIDNEICYKTNIEL